MGFLTLLKVIFGPVGRLLAAAGGFLILIFWAKHQKNRADRAEANLAGVDSERRVEAAQAGIDLATEKEKGEIHAEVQDGAAGAIADRFNRPGGVRPQGGKGPL